MILGFYEVGNVLEYEDPREILAMSFCGVANMVLNQLVIHVLFTKWRNRLDILSSAFVLVGIFNKVFGVVEELQNYALFMI